MFSVSLAKNERKKVTHRSHYGLTFALRGELSYTLNRKEHISSGAHLLLLPKGQTYFLHCTEDGLFPVINFDIANTQSCAQILAFQAPERLAMYDLYRELEAFSKSDDLRNRFHRLSLMYQLLSHAVIPDENRHSSPRRILLQPAIDFLENHYDDPQLSNNTLSKKSCISEAYFRKLFKEEYGISPKQYIQQIRINRAKELLKSDYLNVTAVAEMVGYSSVYNFSKAFKIQTGQAPSEFLKRSIR
ncbi:MAG: AraC family transcriptional regulator [Paenibacillus sp.]|jgi:AraC-like DNA-binding protein|nr:AraC family transcriptional regulator [Paenibacillus sp.]